MAASTKPAYSKDHPILTRVLEDTNYLARLEDDPRTALEELLGPLPADLEFRVVQDTQYTRYLHIPLPPRDGEVSDTDLLAIQGGTTLGCLSVGIGTAIVSYTVTSAISMADTF